jgi:predicted nucleotidyltransferase
VVGAGQGGVQRELKVFADAGIIERSRVGNQVFFQANPRCPIFNELRGLIIKTTGLADVLRNMLKPLERRIHTAFIYGSFAEGRDTRASDVDVMVIGEVEFSEVTNALMPAQETLGREINPTVYPEREFVKKVSDKNNFFGRVLSGKKIFLVGDEDELARLVPKPMAE